MSPVDISAKSPPELELLPGREPITSRHLIAMALASIAVHVIAIALLLQPSRSESRCVDLRLLLRTCIEPCIWLFPGHLSLRKKRRISAKSCVLSWMFAASLRLRSRKLRSSVLRSLLPARRKGCPASCTPARDRASQDSGRGRPAPSASSFHRSATESERNHPAGSASASRVPSLRLHLRMWHRRRR